MHPTLVIEMRQAWDNKTERHLYFLALLGVAKERTLGNVCRAGYWDRAANGLRFPASIDSRLTVSFGKHFVIRPDTVS